MGPLVCRDCGLKIPERSPGGRCPQCLFRSALGKEQGTPADCSGEGSDEHAVGGARRRVLTHFELLKELACGGMGVVWKARDLNLNRLVALKTLHTGSLTSPQAQMRFRMEVEVLAQLSHPNIVTFFEAGEDEGVHFYTMTLVETGTLVEHMSPCPDVPRLYSLVRSVLKVCRAIQFAHQHGVLHRDLKPSNILVNEHGEPLVADFGLARARLPGAAYTLSGAVLGSPHYMAPEQADGSSEVVSTATDVYSLGAILYECCTGAPPFQGDNALRVLEAARQQDPVTPSAQSGFPKDLDRGASRDLDTLILKCLRKDPVRRYSTAQDLADELERWLAGQPVQARPLGWGERLWRECRRRPAQAVAFAAGVALVLVTSIGLALHGARMASANERIAQQAAHLRIQNVELQLRESEALFERGESSRAVATLASVVRRMPENPVANARLRSALELRAFPRLRPGFIRPPGRLLAETSVEGVGIATVTDDGALRFWDPETGGLIRMRTLAGGDASTASFGARGGRVAAAAGNSVWLMDTTTESPSQRFQMSNRVTSVSFDMAGRFFAALDSAGTLHVLDASPSKRSDSLSELAHGVSAFWFAGSNTDRMIIIDAAGRLSALDLSTGNRLWSVEPRGVANTRIAVSPEGHLLAVGRNARVEVLRVETGELVGFPSLFPGAINCLSFSRDARRLAVSCDGLTGDSAHVWHYESRGEPGPALRHRDRITLLEFSGDGSRLLTGSHDCTVRLWDAATGQSVCEPMLHARGLIGVRFAQEDRRVITRSFAGVIAQWELPPPLPIVDYDLGEPVVCATIAQGPDRVAAGGVNGILKVWQGNQTAKAALERQHMRRVWHIDFSPDGKRLVAAIWDGTARVWNLEDNSETVLRHADWSWVMSARFSRDGKFVVTASHDCTARIWEASSGREVQNFRHHEGVGDALLSPDGRFVLTRVEGNRARIWEVGTGKLVADGFEHSSWIQSISFGKDGLGVLTASRDTTMRLWPWKGDDLQRAPYRKIGKPQVHTAPARIERASLSPNGERIVAAIGGHAAAVWDTGGEYPRQILSHNGPVFDARFDATASRVVTASGDRTARIWSSRTGQPMSEAIQHNAIVYVAMFTPDDQGVLTGCGDGHVRLWSAPVPMEISPSWLPELAERMAALKGDMSAGFQPYLRSSVESMDATLERLRQYRVKPKLDGPTR